MDSTLQQLPQLEAMCERLYNSQVRQSTKQDMITRPDTTHDTIGPRSSAPRRDQVMKLLVYERFDGTL
jgi:hypothetical protein